MTRIELSSLPRVFSSRVREKFLVLFLFSGLAVVLLSSALVCSPRVVLTFLSTLLYTTFPLPISARARFVFVFWPKPWGAKL